MGRLERVHHSKLNLATRLLVLVAVLSPCVVSAQVTTRAYPVKPITLIVPFAPGNTDVIARLFLQKISENTGWSFTYDYKPGAAATIGTEAAVRATPDGHTLLMNSPSLLAVALSKRKLSYDWRRDLRPVYQMTKTPTILLVNATLPVTSLKEYVAYAKANPGKINYAMTGSGSIGHLLAVWMHGMMGVEVTYIPYKGFGPIAVAMASGEVVAASPAYKSFHGFITAGKLRALAISSANGRITQLPGVRSIAEEGYPEYDSFSWSGIFTPAATPLPVVERLNTEFAKAIDAKDLSAKLEELGEGKGGGSYEAFARFLASSSDRLVKIVKDSGIEIEE